MLTNFLTDALISQIVQSSACALVGSLGWWGTIRIIDRIAGGRWAHYKRDILPRLQENPIALGIAYAGRSLSLGLIWYGAFAAVRSFG